MLNCKEVTELCSREMELPLGLAEKTSLRMHLMMCDGCSQFRLQMKTLRQVMNAYARGQGVGDDGSGSQDPSSAG